MRIAALAVLAALLLSNNGCATAPRDTQAAPTTVYLVRHAEKRSDTQDPGLTDAGHARASALASRLAQEPLTAIYTTDYRRTRATAEPIAQLLGIRPTLYDPGNLTELAATLRGRSETVLVVGHSNTTPMLATLLGAPDFGAIDEATEYDRLYVLTLKDGQVHSGALERYGNSAEARIFSGLRSPHQYVYSPLRVSTTAY